MEGFEPSRRENRPTPLAGAPLQPLEYISMAPQVGFEPTTDRLTADSSTTELLWNNVVFNRTFTIITIPTRFFNRF